MKFLVAALIAVVAQTSMANCLGEAQIIAKVESVTKTLSSCVAHVSSIEQYNSSMVCALDIEEVVSQGVEVGLMNGHDCRLEPGSVLTGVLVKNAAGKIVLE